MPKTIAIVGASADPDKYGNKAVRAYLRRGWTVYPVTRKPGDIEGLASYQSLRDVPKPLDRVSLYLPPAAGLGVLEDVQAVEPDEFWVNPGAESRELLDRARGLGLAPITACSIVDIGERP